MKSDFDFLTELEIVNVSQESRTRGRQQARMDENFHMVEQMGNNHKKNMSFQVRQMFEDVISNYSPEVMEASTGLLEENMKGRRITRSLGKAMEMLKSKGLKRCLSGTDFHKRRMTRALVRKMKIFKRGMAKRRAERDGLGERTSGVENTEQGHRSQSPTDTVTKTSTGKGTSTCTAN